MSEQESYIAFSAYERRVLEIEQSNIVSSPESNALRNMISSLPWLLEAAEYKFDKDICNFLLLREGHIASAKITCDKHIAEHIKTKAAK